MFSFYFIVCVAGSSINMDSSVWTVQLILLAGCLLHAAALSKTS
jgi:hypothetical protein